MNGAQQTGHFQRLMIDQIDLYLKICFKIRIQAILMKNVVAVKHPAKILIFNCVNTESTSEINQQFNENSLTICSVCI
ncbi:hypothetical protein FGO68_gene9927 [Halteria grandinella]|uniref:Uncharacterized protein n=1 Tax=Halteria grandinella TaxID=5974 RepID=A0A8J8NVX9_HALGN|nr:hypothetical protein FGO68_gene9927 [Halteria grandinella]